MLWATVSYGQEFNCSVSVNYQALSGSDYSYLDEFREQVREYINLQTWTDDRFEEVERIECTIQITFMEAITLTRYRAKVILASRRPIYGTTQSTVILQLNDDDWVFEYAPGTPLISDQEVYNDVTSLLDFYAYIILGYDYDTFSELGGTRHFERARRIAEIAKGTGAPGWSDLGSDRSRNRLVTELLDPRALPVRTAYFAYHFEGLDHFLEETDAARVSVLSALESIQRVVQENARSYVIDVFFAAKYSEMAGIFERSAQGSQAFDVLSEIDPVHISEYQRLIN